MISFLRSMGITKHSKTYNLVKEVKPGSRSICNCCCCSVGVKKFLLLRTIICSVINNKGALNIFGLDFHHKWSRQNKQAEAILGKRTNS